jgi:FMN phosphatase YigB (HAD superfamily)
MDDQATLSAFKIAAMTADIVSFDLFDTLVQRAVWRPDDLFMLLASTMPAPIDAWFAAERGPAEAAVRQKTVAGDITLSAIYNELQQTAPAELDLAVIMDQEVALEIAGIAADGLVVAVFHALIAVGRRVIIVSDMYLPRTTIEAMLLQAGISGYTRLYLSSETGLTKAGGLVWDNIRADFGLTAAAGIVHLGDHPLSDDAVARRHGISSFLLSPPEGRLPVNRYQPSGDPLADVPQAMLRRALAAAAEDPYWLTLAYLVVAPAAIGMAGLIHAKASTEDRRVFFLARDGLVFQKAYETAWRTADMPESHYVWSSRRCLNLAAITTLETTDLDFLVSGISDMTVENYLRRTDLDPAAPEVAKAMLRHGVNATSLVRGTKARTSLRAVFADLAFQIAARAAHERRGLLAHLDQIGLFDGKSLVVDLGWHGSLQRSLIRLGQAARGMTPDMTGVYLGTTVARVPGLRAEGFLFNDGAPQAVVAATIGQSYEVLELLFSAPESGISHVASGNGSVFPRRIDQTEEAPRLAIARLIHDAVVDVAREMRPYLKAEHVTMLRELSLSRLTKLLASPDRTDAAHFAVAPHAEGFGVSSYRPIVPPPGRSLLASARAARTAFWPAGYLARLDPGSRFAVRAINRLHRRFSAPP